jgi:hypothetical protein
MLGRRPHGPSRDRTPLPERGDGRADEPRLIDGPVAFAPTRVGGSKRAGGISAAIVLASALAALVGVGIAGRPAASPGIAAATRLPQPAAITAASAAPDTPAPRPSFIVLTSPSHDEALVVDHLAVVGFVRGESRDVSLLLGEGERVVGAWELPSASKAGDPAWQSRAWFETRLGIDLLPLGRSLWVEVGVVRDDGGVDSVRRSFRLGPIVEPDAS